MARLRRSRKLGSVLEKIDQKRVPFDEGWIEYQGSVPSFPSASWPSGKGRTQLAEYGFSYVNSWFTIKRTKKRVVEHLKSSLLKNS